MADNLEALLGPDTCRLCLKTGRCPTAVSNENLEGSVMAIKIDILTSVKVAPSDKVCPMCRINVKNFYDFRIMCVQSDARIKGFAAKVSAAQENLSVIKSDQVVRSYKRVRRAEVERPSGTIPDPVGTVELFRSTADLFKSKAEASSGQGLFRLKTTPVFMRSEDAFKGLKRPLILGQPAAVKPVTVMNLKPAENAKKIAPKIADPLNMRGHVLDPLLTNEPPPLAVVDPLSSSSNSALSPDPLSSDRDPLSSAVDPFSSVRDPLSASHFALTNDLISSGMDPLSGDEETHNITVEPYIPDFHPDEEDEEDDTEDNPEEITVKMEMEEKEEEMEEKEEEKEEEEEEGASASDTQQNHESDTEGDSSHRESISEEVPVEVRIKEELPDYTETQEAEAEVEEEEEAKKEESLEIHPEEVILPEMKREPDDAELLMETECEEEEFNREEASFSGQTISIKKEQPEKRDDTESLEVLVDPLMLMDEDHVATAEKKVEEPSPAVATTKPVKPVSKNGTLPLPRLNGARSDKQRGLDFVKKLLRENDKEKGIVSPATSEPSATDKTYRCASCDINFTYYKSYLKHKERHLGVQSVFSCNSCPAHFTTNRELHIHMKKHNEKAFSCDRCYRSFQSKERLVAHYSLHTGNKPHICDLCKKSFAYKSSFVFHMRKQHNEVITCGTYLRCPKCPTEWNSPAELKTHMEMHASDELETTSFTCPICAMCFPSKSILNVHARIHQKKGRIYDDFF